MVNYDQLPNTTRTWIYQSSRPFTEEEVKALNGYLESFVDQWVSHNRKLQSFGKVYQQQFIVLMVDESQAGASGCSIDKSVHFLKEVEMKYGVTLFDRMTFAYKDRDEVKTVSRDEFADLYKREKISDETIVFNNLVDTKADFESNWQIPLKQSWHKNMVY